MQRSHFGKPQGLSNLSRAVLTFNYFRADRNLLPAKKNLSLSMANCRSDVMTLLICIISNFPLFVYSKDIHQQI